MIVPVGFPPRRYLLRPPRRAKGPRAARVAAVLSLPPRQVADLIHRVGDDGEPVPPRFAFSSDEEDALYELDCWIDLPGCPELDPEGAEEGAWAASRRGSVEAVMSERHSEGPWELCSRDEATADAGSDAVAGSEIEEAGGLERVCSGGSAGRRRQQGEAVLVWLASIMSRLTTKCAQVCDMAWNELGETVTFQGRPVAQALSEAAVEGAAWGRVVRDKTAH